MLALFAVVFEADWPIWKIFPCICLVGALKAEGLRMSKSNRPRCSGRGGGALGAQMNLFDRLARVIKVSNLKNWKALFSDFLGFFLF